MVIAEDTPDKIHAEGGGCAFDLTVIHTPKRGVFFKGFLRPLEKTTPENAISKQLYTKGALAPYMRSRINTASNRLTGGHHFVYNPLRAAGLCRRGRSVGAQAPSLIDTTAIDTPDPLTLQYALDIGRRYRHTTVAGLMPCPEGLGPRIRTRGRQRCLANGGLESFRHNP